MATPANPTPPRQHNRVNRVIAWTAAIVAINLLSTVLFFSIRRGHAEIALPTTPWRIRLAPSGHALACLSVNRTNAGIGSSVFIADSEQKRKPWKLVQFPDQILRVAWSQDGKALAVGTNIGLVEVWDVTSASRVWSQSADSVPIWGIAFVGSQLIATSGSNSEPGCGGRLTVFDSRTGEIRRTDDAFHDSPTCLVVSAAGEIAYTGANYGGLITEIDLSDGTHRRTFGWHKGITGGPRDDGVDDIAISEDGGLLAAAGYGAIAVWDLAGRRLLHEHRESTLVFLRIQFVPGSSELLTDSFQPKTQNKSTIAIWRLEKGELRQICDYGDRRGDFAISNDGRRVFRPVHHGVDSIDLPKY